MNMEQLERMRTGRGFVAALDQSGGSTPKALAIYGVPADAYSTPEQMFDLVHEMRTRIMTSPSFDGAKVLAAILFEQTIDRQVAGLEAADYLWERKGIVSFVKVDQGLAAEADGVQLMKPLTGLDALLARAVERRIFGTKMRSVINAADPVGISNIAAQQFAEGARIAAAGLVPILEPEISITAADRAHCEDLLKQELFAFLDGWPDDRPLMFKLTIPVVDGFYSDLVQHPKVLRVVALSGGFTRADADARLARNPGLIASFSRALTEGLTAQLSDEAFDEALGASVDAIYAASVTK
jgi:fructose-bisphosphate aldolase, class I